MPMPTNVAGGELVLAAWGNSVVESLPPIGFIGQWPGATAPPNWRICDGTAISRATFDKLWQLFQTSGAHNRYGLGDGLNTFNLPNYRGKYPIGVNSGGGYFSVGVGEVYGNANALIPKHIHGLEQHTHGVNFWSGYVDANHNHYLNMGTLFRHNPFINPDNVNSFGFRIGDGITITLEKLQTDWDKGGQATGIENQNHRHGVNGTTDGASGHNTLEAGGDTVNANLPPSLSVHFIIRVS